MMRSWLIAVFLVGCLAAAAETQRGATSPRFPLLPVDEAAHDKSFLKFRTEFIAAVKSRDVEGVIRNVDASVDGSRGKDALRGRLSWNGGDNPSWAQLESALALGGSFTTTRGRVEQRREFCAPYTYSTYPWPVPLQFADELEPWVVLHANVPVRSAPAASAAVIGRLSHELVKMTGAEAPGSPPILWVGVELAEGSLGWIAADDVRDPTDYHACFANLEGNWRLTTFERGVVPR